jgi:hypothetical protein
VTDDAPPDNVLHPTFGEPGKQTEIKRNGAYCFHRQYDLDEGDKTVTCGRCGAPLEAFQVLLDYAHRERHWRYLDGEARDLEKKLAELKDEERRVKSRTASASRKDANAAVEHEQQATFVRRQAIADKAKDVAELARQIVRLARVDSSLPDPSSVFRAGARQGGARRKRGGGK